MYKIILILVIFNVFVFTYCQDLASIKNQTEIIKSIKNSDDYYEGIITISEEEANYEIHLTHSAGFKESFLIILEADSGDIIKFIELEKDAVSWQQNFKMSKGEYKLYYPSYIEVFYSKSDAKSSFTKQQKTYYVNLYAYDKDNNIIASASGSANSRSKAWDIAENYLRTSAPDAVLITDQKIKEREELTKLVNYTMQDGKIDKIIIDCRKISFKKQEAFADEIHNKIYDLLSFYPPLSLHWEDENLIKISINAENINIDDIKKIETLILTLHKNFRQN